MNSSLQGLAGFFGAASGGDVSCQDALDGAGVGFFQYLRGYLEIS